MKLDLNVPNGFVCTSIDENEIYKKFDELNLNIVAVRSSAICEDSKENSFAGQFETILNVDKTHLIESVYKCFKSSNEINVKQYAIEKNVPENQMKVAVIVQEMIDGDISGVMFTKNPINNNNEIVIEFVRGLGEKLVQGEATPSQVIVENKKIKQYLGDKLLTENTIIKLANIATKIEKHFGIPQDIEWTIKNDIIYVLQARPITI